MKDKEKKNNQYQKYKPIISVQLTYELFNTKAKNVKSIQHFATPPTP